MHKIVNVMCTEGTDYINKCAESTCYIFQARKVEEQYYALML